MSARRALAALAAGSAAGVVLGIGALLVVLLFGSERLERALVPF